VVVCTHPCSCLGTIPDCPCSQSKHCFIYCRQARSDFTCDDTSVVLYSMGIRIL